MLAKERQKIICEMLQKKGAVETSYLSNFFNVSVETIRKDFLALEKSKELIRTHGGAIVTGNVKSALNLSERCEENTEGKQCLVLKALNCISEGNIIAIDEGSTAIMLATAIRDKFHDLTVITYSLDVFNILCNEKNFKLILCGGNYMKSERCFCGAQTLDCLKKLYFQKSFIFPSSISLEFGICFFTDKFSEILNELVRSSEQIFILADSSKFEKRSMYKLCEMNDKFYYLTDDSMSKELRSLYNKNNINIK